MEKDLEKQLVEQQIKSLLVRERYYRDTAQWENLRNSYHPDVSKTGIKITWYYPPLTLAYFRSPCPLIHSPTFPGLREI